MKAICKAGHNQTMIATILSTHKYKVSRGLQRKRGLRGYYPKQVQVKAMQRQHKKNLRALESPGILESFIETFESRVPSIILKYYKYSYSTAYPVTNVLAKVNSIPLNFVNCFVGFFNCSGSVRS
jgi:IS30 family transposase